MKKRLIFFGTQEWAAKLLDCLVKDGFFEVALVVTQPDQQLGRKKNLMPTPVKQTAMAHGLTVIEPTRLRYPAFLQTLKNINADLALVVAYGRILPQEVISTPLLGTLNVHPSLLPKWRGPSPVQSAIANGDTVSGITIMRIDEQMDHGPILAQKEIQIDSSETFLSFMKKVLDVALMFFVKTLKDYVDGLITAKEQNHAEATVCSMLTRADGRIDWNKRAQEIERMVRAYQPWPGTWTEFIHDKKINRLKILKSHVDTKFTPTYLPGTIFESQKRLLVATGSGILELISVQPEGKAPMTAQAFLSGYAQILGSVLKS